MECAAVASVDDELSMAWWQTGVFHFLRMSGVPVSIVGLGPSGENPANESPEV